MEIAETCVVTAVGKEFEKTKQMTLGELIMSLEGVKDKSNKSMVFNGCLRPSEPHSYRGYYEELAFSYEILDCYYSVSEFLKVCKACVGKTFTGWRGGDYKMTKNTPVWFSFNSECSGVFPVRVEEEKNFVRLVVSDPSGYLTEKRFLK